MNPTTTNAATGAGSLRELTGMECWQHLAEHSVGRIAYVEPDGPVILPLNYVAHDGKIWLRTASYDQMAIHLPGMRAAFQVDHVDEHDQSGWSVLVRGRAEHVLADQHPQHDGPGSTPWAAGTRTMTFCLTADEVTGRLLHGRDVTPPAGHGPGSIQRSTHRSGGLLR